MIVPAQTSEQLDTAVAYVASKIGRTPRQLVGSMPFAAHFAMRGGKPVGAVLYTNYRVQSVEMAWAGEPGWATRSTIRDMFAYPLVTLGCFRVWGFVKKSNKASRAFAERLGCKTVGVAEHEFGPGEDAIIYSMTRAHCRWLPAAPIAQTKTAAYSGNGVAAHG